MQIERYRFGAEMLGIGALVISLIFVAYQLKQTRDMNMAQLEFNRLSLGHARYLAMLESEPMLSVFAKTRGRDWNNPQFSELEKGAALVEALALIQQWRIEYKFINLGFPVRAMPLETEIADAIEREPAIVAAWQAVWASDGDHYGFEAMMHEMLANK